jgi:hypothetical protein
MLPIILIALFTGCATWGGIKKDAKDSAEWTKEKVHSGANYVKEKTE